MAKVTIVFEDAGDGLEVESIYDPPLTIGAKYEELSDAQRLGFESEEIILREIESGFANQKKLVLDFSKLS